VRQELAGLEADVALCERCFGPERRLAARFARPADRPRVVLLGERPPRSVLQSEDRLGLHNADGGTRFLVELLDVARIPPGQVLLGAAVMCRPAARRLESAVGLATCVGECAVHVRELIRLAEPALVVPLGKAALRSLRLAFPERPALAALRFPESVGRTVDVGSFAVHPLYHVTVRARMRRAAEQQRRDWGALGRTWRDLVSRSAEGAPA
jgi:uracil-DNA glycosylase